MFKFYNVNVYYRHRKNQVIDASDFSELFTAQSLWEFVERELDFNDADPPDNFTINTVLKKLEAGKQNLCFEIDQDENNNGIIVNFSLK